MRRRRLLSAAIVATAVALSAPTGAQAATRNCCFELTVLNQSSYSIDYGSDGLGYDGEYNWTQTWEVRAIVGYSDAGKGTLKKRAAYSRVGFYEFSTLTRCRAGARPCFNRELLPCPGMGLEPATAESPAAYNEFVGSGYLRGGGVAVDRRNGRAGLVAKPSDRVYYSVGDRNRCSTGHGHHGFGEEAEGVADERAVKLKLPRRALLRTAGEGDRCSHEFGAGLSLGPPNPPHVGSDPAAPHTWSSRVDATYHISHFPKSRLKREKQRLKDLGHLEFPSQSFNNKWGQHGSRERAC